MNAEDYLIKPENGRDEPIKDLNNAQRVVLVDKDTVGAEDLTFALCTFEAKTSVHKKHIHQHAEEVIYILSGKGMSGIGDSETVMSQGDTMFVPRGAVHWFYNPFDEPVQMIFIYTKSSLGSAGYRVVE
ncbi:MAG: cupin domain-containing protein [Smithella sp.]|jgi:quercetin dioxygenase-like cupin family protein